MPNKFTTVCLSLAVASVLTAGCSSNQTVHNAWKSTKGLWYTYASPPASIDYEESGEMSPYELALATRMMGIDIQLGQLERVMNNADKPPTAEWLNGFFARFPWMGGFAGVKADGQIIGQEPAAPMKSLDFLPLLEEDKKQNMRALRGYVEDTPLGPEVLLAAPLYEASNFLGVVIAHFDMRALLRYATDPEELVIVAPQAVLWPGKYDIAATPMNSVDWETAVRKNSKGTVSNANGTFYWVARYLGNQPLIFGVPVSGTFPEKTGQLDLPGAGAGVGGTLPESAPMMIPTDLQPGSSDSMLLPGDGAARPSPFGPKVDERDIE